MNDVRAVTDDYEAWLAGQIEVVDSGLQQKHAELAAKPLAFLRGTYYLWLVRVAELLPETLERPGVPLVGDLHVENFGTWRDRQQVRRWGVNDLDELADGAWLLDLLRLATSAVVAPHIRLTDAEVCDTLLTSYAEARPGVAVDLAGPGAEHLAGLVPPLGDQGAFYGRLAAGPSASVPADVERAAAGVAEPGWAPTWHEHTAGTGSLGHRRAVGVGPAADGRVHAREAKQLGPGTTVWARRRGWVGMPTPADLYAAVAGAVSGPAGATRAGEWQIRDLAPDVVRIELAGLHRRDARRLLRSMAHAVADVHGASPKDLASAQRDAGTLTAKDLEHAVGTMVDSVRKDFASWRS